MEQTPWYSDGVNESERKRITELFRLYVAWANENATRLDAFGPYSADPLPEWPEPFVSALQSSFVESFTSTNGKQIDFFVYSPRDRFAARATLDAISDYLNEVERYAGPVNSTGILVVVRELEEGLCGLASYYPAAKIEIDPECADAGTVVHELTHHATPGTYAVWFTEGYAALLSRIIVGERDRDALEEFADGKTFNLDWGFFTPEAPRDDYGTDSAVGLLFLLNVVDLIGIDALSEVVRSLYGDPSGQWIISSIYRATPPDKQEEMVELIRTSCVDRGRPCDPT